jgi:hypothetical protein
MNILTLQLGSLQTNCYIIYDQKYKHNLAIRKMLEAAIVNYTGDRSNEDWKALETYAKRVFFSNGIHHHYSNAKFIPTCSSDYYFGVLSQIDATKLPLNGKSFDEFKAFYSPIIFDSKLDAKIVNLAAGIDNVKASANNFYEGVTQAEVEAYYASRMKANDVTPISWGLNSKMMKENGQVVEKTWKLNGMYHAAIEKIIYRIYNNLKIMGPKSFNPLFAVLLLLLSYLPCSVFTQTTPVTLSATPASVSGFLMNDKEWVTRSAWNETV